MKQHIAVFYNQTMQPYAWSRPYDTPIQAQKHIEQEEEKAKTFVTVTKFYCAEVKEVHMPEWEIPF